MYHSSFSFRKSSTSNGKASLTYCSIEFNLHGTRGRHEHIYSEVEAQLIRTDELPVDLPRFFGGTNVILCTISTLSSPALQGKGMFDVVRVENLVVDEASQIALLDYLVSP